jgi:hypothetical protein
MKITEDKAKFPRNFSQIGNLFVLVSSKEPSSANGFFWSTTL